MNYRAVVALAAVAAAAFASPGAYAQSNFPNQPITIVVGSNTGGSADFGSRMYADVMSKILGVRITVENKPGAAGILSAEYVKGKPADGYTLVQFGSGIPEALPAMQTLPFDPLKDFTYITPLTKSENYLWIRADLPVNNLKEYIAYAKKNGVLTVGNSGAGTPASIALALLKSVADAPITIVNYKGNAESVNDLIAGRIESVANGYLTGRPALELGKGRVIAINSDTRSRRFPDVPTYAEGGYPGVAVPTWWGLFGPKGMPQAVVDKIYAAAAQAAKDPVLLDRYHEQDLEPYTMPGDKFLAMVTENQARQSKIIKQLGLKME